MNNNVPISVLYYKVFCSPENALETVQLIYTGGYQTTLLNLRVYLTNF